MKLRALLIGVALGAVAIPAVGYANWSSHSGLSTQKRAELYSITQIESKWHKAASTKNLRLTMSLWAPKATMTIGGETYTGKAAIRKVFAKSGPFQPQNHWISDTAAYKIRATVNGNKGTLYFEC